MIETNPVLARLWRGDDVESLHRGAWVLCRTDGSVVAACGDPDQLVYARSATKSLQALPLIESGAADRFGLPTEALALALASHSGEPEHARVVADTLSALGLGEADLRCGPQAPMFALPGTATERILNNCSGKHAGFLAVAAHLGQPTADYLEPAGVTQRRVADAVMAMTGTSADDLHVSVDGCSAPTFGLPLRGLATGLARMATPDALTADRAEACRRLTAAAAAHPELVAGSHARIDTDLLSVTEGRVFAKIGAEGVHASGIVGQGLGLAIKVDDGNERGFHALLIALLQLIDAISDDEAARLDAWGSLRRSNWDGLEIGRTELTQAALLPII